MLLPPLDPARSVGRVLGAVNLILLMLMAGYACDDGSATAPLDAASQDSALDMMPPDTSPMDAAQPCPDLGVELDAILPDAEPDMEPDAELPDQFTGEMTPMPCGEPPSLQAVENPQYQKVLVRDGRAWFAGDHDLDGRDSLFIDLGARDEVLRSTFFSWIRRFDWAAGGLVEQELVPGADLVDMADMDGDGWAELLVQWGPEQSYKYAILAGGPEGFSADRTLFYLPWVNPDDRTDVYF